MDRPFAPTPRRRALARAAGLVLASPAWTGGLALAAAVVALAATVGAAAATLTERTRVALAGAAEGDVVTRATGAGAPAILADVLAAVAPVLLAGAAGALAAGAALARGLVVPQRRIPGAPAAPNAPGTDAGLALARAAAVAAVAVSFVVTHAGPLTGLATAGARPTAAGVGALAVTALAHAAVAAVLAGVLDALVRHGRLAAALRMTAREARDDARQAGLDPQARRRLRDARAVDPRERVRDASLLLVGADVAVALRWTPGAPAPDIVAAGHGLAGRQLVVAARQRAVPALADDALAGALVGQRAVPAAHQAAVARALAALG